MKDNIMENYLRVCREAVENDEVFANFKNDFHYTKILEHVWFELGQEYLDQVKQDFPYLLEHMKRFATNDKVGNPTIYYYEDIDLTVSPTTLRYVKVLADLMNHFGRLDDMDIIEIGGGYGGQCKIIYDISRPKSYTIVDLPDVLHLINKYLKEFDIKNVILKEPRDKFGKQYDLCISNYSFTEVSREDQDYYKLNIIQRSLSGYMTCNFIYQDKSKSEQGQKRMGRGEVGNLMVGGYFYPECPLTYPNNKIYVWNSRLK